MSDLDEFKLFFNLRLKNKYIEAFENGDILIDREFFDFVIENDNRPYKAHLKSIYKSIKIYDEDSYYFEKFYTKYKMNEFK